MKVAVIGGGIFGCTAAIHLANAGHKVTLFEKTDSLFSGATSKNQFRLHEGYHYPRSQETVEECERGLFTFTEDYSGAIIAGNKRVYAIAPGSKTSPDDYIEFCAANNLPFIQFPRVPPSIVRNVEISGYVQEDYIDIQELHKIVRERLKKSGVQVVFNIQHAPRAFDHYVVAGYASNEEILSQFGLADENQYQYEVCEKPIIKMPDYFGDHSVVIMDGPFGCVDPYANTQYHLMGHVDYAVHYRTDDYIDAHHKMRTLERGERFSNFHLMQDDLYFFIPALDEAEHMRSMYVIRAVLAGKDATDERPTIVTQLSDDVTQIFSGKIPCCVDAAKSVVSILENRGG